MSNCLGSVLGLVGPCWRTAVAPLWHNFGTGFHESDTSREPVGNQSGTSREPVGNQSGTPQNVAFPAKTAVFAVFSRFPTGSRLVPDWFPTGSRLVPDWFPTGVRFVESGVRNDYFGVCSGSGFRPGCRGFAGIRPNSPDVVVFFSRRTQKYIEYEGEMVATGHFGVVKAYVGHVGGFC